MITATIRDNGFRVEGHANMAPSGQDIVCAGVSALVGGLLAALESEKVWHKLDKRDGYISCEFYDGYFTDPQQYMYSVLICGLENIQQQYPEYLRVVNDS